MNLSALSLYQPAWLDGQNTRVRGPDEDEVTMTVAAIRPLVESGAVIDEIYLVTRNPSLLEGDTAAVITQAVGLEHVPVQLVVGGAPAVVELLFSSNAGAVIVAVELVDRAGAGAMFVGHEGASLTSSGSFAKSLPLRVREAGETSARVYDDPRLLREAGWKPALNALVADKSCVVVGVPRAFLKSIDCDFSLSEAVEAGGPAAVPFALAKIIDQGSGRIIAIEQASAEAASLEGSAVVIRNCREGLALPEVRMDGSADIPISLAAYSRAFEAKVGLLAGRCEECGTLSYPPRYRCLGCGAEGRVPLSVLPRNALVYTVVTVRIPVPGLASPYSLAIVELEATGVRVLVQVTDVVAGTTKIGEDGTLVLRKIADRQGIPDYGYAFQPNERRTLEVAK